MLKTNLLVFNTKAIEYLNFFDFFFNEINQFPPCIKEYNKIFINIYSLMVGN